MQHFCTQALLSPGLHALCPLASSEAPVQRSPQSAKLLLASCAELDKLVTEHGQCQVPCRLCKPSSPTALRARGRGLETVLTRSLRGLNCMQEHWHETAQSARPRRTIHSNAHVCLLQGRCIIDAVSSHAHKVPRALQNLHDRMLVLGEDLCEAVCLLDQLCEAGHT